MGIWTVIGSRYVIRMMYTRTSDVRILELTNSPKWAGQAWPRSKHRGALSLSCQKRTSNLDISTLIKNRFVDPTELEVNFEPRKRKEIQTTISTLTFRLTNKTINSREVKMKNLNLQLVTEDYQHTWHGIYSESFASMRADPTVSSNKVIASHFLNKPTIIP